MYDVFISYSLQDREWAEKLEQGLSQRKLTVFRDATRLTAGDEWDIQLQESLANSKNLVVLWSDNARGSDWVSKELTHFSIIRDSDRNRHLIPINLQGQNKTLDKFEYINLLQTSGAYEGGIEKLTQVLWNEVLDKVEEAVSDPDEIRVHFVIMASTLNDLAGISLTYRTNSFAQTFEETLTATGVLAGSATTLQADLARFYGAGREDWKPFGGVIPIKQILADLRTEILSRPIAPKFRWRPIDDEFWSTDFDTVAAAADALQGELVVVIIDPVSLYDEQVRDRLEILKYRLQRQSGMSLLTPYPLAASAQHLREFIRRSAEEVYNQFYRPFFTDVPLRLHIDLCGDKIEMERLVSSLLRPSTKNSTPTTHPALRS